ncbi:MAG TPA: alginate export family protein [Salinimicrobium sp.]|nr:alginate export family protein [Salinimicrobium sp.]
MKKIILFFIVALTNITVFSQDFSIDLELRPKYELRNGYKNFISNDENPASFISQRSRINFNFTNEKIGAKLSLQNVRVWGDVPISTARDQNAVAVFEAYAEYFHNEKMHFKLGRQIVSYDNQRIFGVSDWSQAGQSHDLFKISYRSNSNMQIDLGFAVNAETEAHFQTGYAINNYKNLQYAWYHIDMNTSGLSFLLLNTGYEQETVGTTFKVNYLQTFGSYFNFKKNNWFADFSGYAQTGEKSNTQVTAFYVGSSLLYSLNPNWKVGAGAEYISGTDMNESSDKLHSFTPLFGTNHGFNGTMDYFYTGNHLNSVGLINPYFKILFSKEKITASIVPHLFFAEASVVDFTNKKYDSYLGNEIDFSASYKFNKDFKLDFGYSQMFGTETLEFLKQKNPSGMQNWIWIKFTFHPVLFSHSNKLEVPDPEPSI